MATRTEIEQNINITRENISHRVDELSNILHEKIAVNEKVKEKIKENPYESLAIALAIGFGLAAFSSPIGRHLFKIASRSAMAAAGAYFSKKGLEYVSSKVKIE